MIFQLFLYFLFISGSLCQQIADCGRNEEWQECGTSCPLTCANPEPSRRCDKRCNRGCFCTKGFLRNDVGECVPLSRCSAQQSLKSECGPHEVFNHCGTSCPTTCANPEPPMRCNKRCNPGCFCKEGYLRNDFGDCVPHSRCFAQEDYKKCGSRAVYRCGTTCPTTCENYRDPPKFCTMDCKYGCFCKEPFIMFKAKNRCVKPEQCLRVRARSLELDDEAFENEMANQENNF